MPLSRQKLTNGLCALVICAVTAGVLHEASRAISADWTSSIARHELVKWASGEAKFTDDDWRRVHADLTQAVTITPDDATLHDALAQLYSVKGRNLWTTGASDSPEIAAYQQAMVHQQASIQLRPGHAMAWANLALIRLAINSTPEEFFQAWREAARLGPKEIDVENTLVLLTQDAWAIAPGDVRAWVEQRRPGFAAEQAKAAASAATQ